MSESRTELIPPVPPVDPARVEATVKILLTGTREYDVAQAVRELWPDQELGPLVVACGASLADAGRFEPDILRGWCVEASKAIYRRCIDAGEWAAALRAIKQIYEMAGKAERGPVSQADDAKPLDRSNQAELSEVNS